MNRLGVAAVVTALTVSTFTIASTPHPAAAATPNPYAALAILDPTGDVVHHDLTPDGMWVVYRTTSDLRSVPAGGGSVRTLFPTPADSVHVSPDSSAAAFPAGKVLRQVAVAGATPVVLFTATGAASIGQFGYTGDSRHVWLMSDQGTTVGSMRLWVVPAAGGTPVLLTPATAVDRVTPSPDGSSLAFDRFGNLFVVPVDGSSAPAQRNEVLTMGALVHQYDWSLDGGQLAFTVRLSITNTQVWTVPARIGSATLLTPAGANATFVRSPDSDRMVVHTVDAGAVTFESMLVDGSDRRTLVGPPASLVALYDVGTTKVLYTDAGKHLFVGSILGGALEALGPLPVVGAWLSADESYVVWQLPTTFRLQAREIPQQGILAGGRTISGDDAELVRTPESRLGVVGADAPVLFTEGGDLRIADPTAVTVNRSIDGSGPPAGTSYENAVGTPDMRRVVFVAVRAGRHTLMTAGPDPATNGETLAYSPVTPARVLDTRLDGPQLNYAGGTPVAGQTIALKVRGIGGVPNLPNVKAVVLNVTLTEATAPGFVTVWPDGSSRPLASSLNVTAAGQTRANLVTVRVPPSGVIDLFTQTGGHLIADVAGYYSDAATAGAGRFFPLSPRRLLDTRADGPQLAYTGPKPGVGAQIDLVVAGRAGVAADASAVVLNVTATEASGPGFVTVWPAGGTRPLASNLNLVAAGQTSANQVIVPVGAGGAVSLFTQSGTHLVADVAGWYTGTGELSGTSGLFVAGAGPTRVLDTRADGPQVGYRGGTPTAGQSVRVPLSARGVAAWVMNVTFTEATLPGFVTASPRGLPRPLASNLNAVAGDTVAGHVTVAALRSDDSVLLFTQAGGHLLADVVGRFVR